MGRKDRPFNYDEFLHRLELNNEQLVNKFAHDVSLEEIPVFRRRREFAAYRLFAAIHALSAGAFLALVAVGSLWWDLSVRSMAAPLAAGVIFLLAAPVYFLVGRHRRAALQGSRISLMKDESYLLMALVDRRDTTLDMAMYQMQNVERVWIDQATTWPYGKKIKVRLKGSPDIERQMRIPGLSPTRLSEHGHVAPRTLLFVQRHFPEVKVGAPGQAPPDEMPFDLLDIN